MTPALRKSLRVVADIVRGVLLGLLLCYAVQSTILADAGAVIVRYAGY